MIKTFNFGKIGFENKRRALNEVTIEMEYKEDEEKKELSICGNVWNERHTDIICGGQCLDTLKPYFKNNQLFNEIYRLWVLYHLNNMRAECKHQRALGWLETAKKEVVIYHWYLNKEAREAKELAKKKALDALKNGETFTPSEEEVFYTNLDIFCTTYTPEAPKYYDIETDFNTKKQKIEVKKLGLVYPHDHLDGILTKACPVCGYKYGSGWLYEPIPSEDEKIIYKLLKDGNL